MPRPRTHLLVLLAAICVAEPFTTPNGSDNEVLKHTEASLTKSQNLEIENAIGNFSRTEQGAGPATTPAASFNTTSTPAPAPTPAPQCPGNQVVLVGSEGCGCPVGMVNVAGENCTCPVGYTLQRAAGCLDVDECKGEGPGPCSLHADCTNTPGSYLCKCLRGYLMGAGGCQDIDECALAEVTGLQACGSGADCRNTLGSFSCFCPVGYVMALDGHSCVDVDECSFEEQCRRELGNVCVNTPGSFVCQPGFRAEVPACIGLIHPYLRYRLQPSSSTCNIRFASHILLKVPKAHTPLGHSFFQFAASSHWNELQQTLKLDSFISISSFKDSIIDTLTDSCGCFA